MSPTTDHVTHLSVRADPDRVLPAGIVFPRLLKHLLPPPARDEERRAVIVGLEQTRRTAV